LQANANKRTQTRPETIPENPLPKAIKNNGFKMSQTLPGAITRRPITPVA